MPMAHNKVIFDGTTLIDLTGDTATASDVASGKTFHLANGNSATGTATGSALNFQVSDASARRASTSYGEVLSLACSVTGTYTIYYCASRTTTSGTSGTRLYINGSAYASAVTTWDNSYFQTQKYTGVELSAGDEVQVYARSRSNSYYVCVGNITLEQTA